MVLQHQPAFGRRISRRTARIRLLPYSTRDARPLTGQKGYYNTFTYNGQTYYADYTLMYGRRWTYVGGLSPAGLQAKFLPRSRMRPMLTLMTGFAVSPRDIPMFDSSAFNFTFSFGAGFDFFQRPGREMRFEYRIQHLSNADLGWGNPGIDSQVIHVGYAWGR